MNLGGDCHVFSDQTKKRISKALKGKTKSPDHCAKLSMKKKDSPVRYWKGKTLSDEHRRKMSEAHKGVKTNRKFSDEARKKMSEKRKLYWAKRKREQQ